jgi:hypothetical protein
MTEHHSDVWPERRWAVERSDSGGVKVHWFTSEAVRDRWIAQRRHHRRAVGKRHPAVKALRQQWRATALDELRARKGR